MATDKKEYQSVVMALVDHGTFGSVINKFNKLYIETEDGKLRKLIAPVIAELERGLRDLPNKYKSAKISLRDQVHREPHKSLVDYCQKCLSSAKPQWQIIAERHGWGPKDQPAASK